ncbi:hypothetical protein STW0522PSE72_20390 [Pseudomonas monteilii]|nr:hypothetical protein STW0522PSE72_20390 [Pseudomonas monteilii]
MALPRTCCICSTSLHNKRLDSRTCSSSCRSKLFRSNRAKTVLVKLCIPNDVFTHLTIKAFHAQKTLNDYLVQLVLSNE